MAVEETETPTELPIFKNAIEAHSYLQSHPEAMDLFEQRTGEILREQSELIAAHEKDTQTPRRLLIGLLISAASRVSSAKQ